MSASLEEARAAKAVLAERLRGHPAVNGVGIAAEGEGHLVRINVSEPVEDLPVEQDGVPVRTRVVGPIVKR
ncbi:MAG: hypothetical protein H0V26_10600 [Solirubrobacterales bacterium]|nr:hypothetical protein [Solirubrobacterales bacterium]